MDTPKRSGSDDKVNLSNITITIHMKKMDSPSSGSSALLHQQALNSSRTMSSPGDANNNSSAESEKANAKSEPTGKKAFYKLIFKSSSGSNNDSNNNNPTNAPANNSYTKVSMERNGTGSLESKRSQLNIDKSRQLTPASQASSVSVNQKYNSSLDEYQLEDADEKARIQRAIEIQEGVEIDQLDSNDLIENISRTNEKLWNFSQQIPLQSRHMGNITDDNDNVRGIHSQVSYRHCLVPDLEKITACCYYWGKMDRYEAEKLLENKPEGTFLLRDSAQDDYLFSVSFRKYGRSLHARIEQYNHKFSFDSHDPSVFTANTVTGLLEHYKDPTSVMFFEPMLTSPLHRNCVFSLQQLCRAAIVSHTTYDGINKLCLPFTLKNYLREYHYKFRVKEKKYDDETLYHNS